MTEVLRRPGVIRSLIPARIDRMPWSPFHTRMVIALGTAWVLEGLEITVAGAVAGTLSEPAALNLSSTEVGAIATVYLVGEVVGALFFGNLSDKLGRRKLFMVTLGVYLTGSGLTALTMGSGTPWIVYRYATRFIAGMGIGGEYAAMHSAIDELIPARYRGRVDIGISGTYWGGREGRPGPYRHPGAGRPVHPAAEGAPGRDGRPAVKRAVTTPQGRRRRAGRRSA